MTGRSLPADRASAAEERRLTEDEFADVFTDHARALWCVAAGVLGHRDLVEDVLQEGAIIALRKLDQFEPGTSFMAWMSRIVRYVALNHARRRRRQPETGVDPGVLSALVVDDAAAADPAATDARGELAADQSAFDDRVAGALRTLEETARACLLLRTVLHMPYREIALALDIPEGTAMSHVHRARHSLRDRLRGTEEPAAALARGRGL